MSAARLAAGGTTRARPGIVVTALVVAAAFAAFAAIAAGAGPVAAHSADGVMGIEVTPGTAPLTAKVRVLLEYASDRHVVPGATVTATASGPDGATVGPVPLDDKGEGGYETVLTLPTPGSWTVTVSAADPVASATEGVTVAAGSTTSGRIEGNLGSTPTTTGATPDDIEISADRAAQDQRQDDDGGTSPALIAAIVVVLVAAAGVVVVLVRGRRASP